MSRAIICDRCGAVVESVQDSKHVALSAVSKCGDTVPTGNPRGHLCPGCATEFKRWFYEKRNGKEGEE